MLTVYNLRLGHDFQSNCYVVANDKKEAFAVDIGGEAQELIKFLSSKELTLKKIFLTHGHYDHFRGTAETVKNTGAKVYIHREDEAMMTDAERSLAYAIGFRSFNSVDEYEVTEDGDVIDFSGVPVKVIHTPGHTKGGVCYVCENKIFSGDTLFRMSIGRTDFPGGDFNELMASLKKLKNLSENMDYEVYPGHESTTTLLNEIERNPYMR